MYCCERFALMNGRTWLSCHLNVTHVENMAEIALCRQPVGNLMWQWFPDLCGAARGEDLSWQELPVDSINIEQKVYRIKSFIVPAVWVLGRRKVLLFIQALPFCHRLVMLLDRMEIAFIRWLWFTFTVFLLFISPPVQYTCHMRSMHLEVFMAARCAASVP